MKKLAALFELKEEKWLYAAAFILFFPAMLINLGITPLLADEPTRALVALEMMFSENFITPTINGDYYYNKPPLYNWLLVLLFKLTGSTSEFVVRLPTVISIGIFAGLMYFFLTKFVNARTAIFTVLFYITCGRILFYDSFLGLIDTLFSAVIFTNFMILYYYEQKNEVVTLFVLSYLCITVAFFLKGLPALVFQGLSLGVLFWFRKNMKVLFSWKHFLGIGLFLVFLAVYYSFYLQYNSIEELFKTLISESTKRTIADKSIWVSVLHFISFPFELLFHFLPWTFPLLFLAVKRFRAYVFNDDFLKYIVFMFIVNSGVYWLSPETRPRYLFMFLPLLFIISAEAIQFFVRNNYRLIFENFLGVVLVCLFFVALGFLFFPNVVSISYYYVKLGLVVVSLFLLVGLFAKNKDKRIMVFVVALLVVRIGFNWFVFPYRLSHDPHNSFRQSAINVGELTKGQPLKILKHTPINHLTSYYITRERSELLPRSIEDPKPNVFYLTDVLESPFSSDEVMYSFSIEYNNTQIYLVKLP